MEVEVRWQKRNAENEEWRGALYAILSKNREILYIGKAWESTVAERLSASDKKAVYEHIEESHDLDELSFLVGAFWLEKDRRLTAELVSDVESLLIYEEQPTANIQSIYSRETARKGMVVKCTGKWPGEPRYVDPGPMP